MLQQAHQLLFALLRAGMWKNLHGVSALLPVSPACWQQVYALARAQTVTGLVYAGICQLPDHLLPPPALLMQWVAQVEVIERNNRQANRALQKLTHCLTAQGLHPILLKGQGLAACYPEPLLRECGDIDLCFDVPNEAEAALRCVQQTGCKPKSAADGSYHYNWMGVKIEHHARYTDAASPRLQRLLQQLAEQYPPVHASTLTGTPALRTPAPLPNLMLLNLHILKHAMGRGIGLRQFIDLALFTVQSSGVVPAENLRQTHRRLKLQRWSRLLYAFLQEHLGLPDNCNPYAAQPLPATASLLKQVIDEGNFGRGFAPLGKPPHPTAWKRKLNTAKTFAGKTGFSLRYAPAEAFFTFTQLLFGQRKS